MFGKSSRGARKQGSAGDLRVIGGGMPRLRFVFALALALVTSPRGVRAAAPFAETGPAFLQKHCVSCHGPEKQKGNVTLHQIKDERALLRAGRRWKDVMNLVQSGEMPPEDAREQPTAEERKRFLESSLAVFARADQAPPDPGKLTLRRLNRKEYNNTIRDLLQVDFRPADNFPSDDVGYGFDQIADVLSVSPVLMERYLEAAANIAEQAVPLTAALPPKRRMIAKYCEPAEPGVTENRFRPICASEKRWMMSGPMHTPLRILPENEYVMRVRLYAQSASGAPVKIALLVAGEKIAGASPAAEVARLDGGAMPALQPCVILKTFEMTARDESQAQVFEAKISSIAGAERIAVAAFKPPRGEPPPTLFVEYLECEGPLDPRSPATKALMVFSPDKSPRDQAREVLIRFVSRAWRRPITKDELDRLAGLMEYTVGHAESWEEALRRALTAVLASPKFVFRLEPDDQPDNPAAHPVDDFQLATRLSYFLWSSCPDDELLRLAAKRKLVGSLDAQIQRMLKDPRASALVDNFAVQWLQIGRLVGHSADAKTFPRWQPELRAAMLEETRRFCGEIFREDRSVLDLLDADFTWVDRRLAELYRLQPPGGFRGEEWRRVSLAGSPRGGLLTQASVLTVTSNPTRTSPVKRGKWVLEQLLGTPPPPPPPNVPSLDDAQRHELTGTFRQKLEQHRHDPKCAGCHEKMDAFGFTLENFDGIGQWRDRDETGAPIDASAKLPGQPPFAGLTDLKAMLREHQRDFTRCLTEKMLIYALGRGLDYYDEPAIASIQSALSRKNYRFSALVSEIVKSTPFLLRRGQSQTEPVNEPSP
jgi:hypothetical protein